MYTPTHQVDQEIVQSPKIIFSQKVFGKATKGRTEDPSMFQLLKWNTHGLQQSNFRKNQRFTDPETAYLNMISKQSWISQTQENFLNYHTNSIEVNQQVFHDVQNYLHSQQSGQKNAKLKKKGTNQQSIKQTNRQPKTNKQNQKYKTQSKNHNIIDKVEKVYQKSQIPIKKAINNQSSAERPTTANKRPQSSKAISEMNSPQKQSLKAYYNPKNSQLNKNSIQRREDITEEEQQKLIQKFKQTTRWIPNSAFTTYFGKPPFENYGRGNTKPVDGGLVYGTYLYSHNVFPHRGSNSPSHIQSYPVALMKAESMGKLVPSQPKTACKYLQNKINNKKEKNYSSTGAIEAHKNTFKPLEIQVPDLRGVEKFGGTKKSTQNNWRTGLDNEVSQHTIQKSSKYANNK